MSKSELTSVVSETEFEKQGWVFMDPDKP